MKKIRSLREKMTENFLILDFLSFKSKLELITFNESHFSI